MAAPPMTADDWDTCQNPSRMLEAVKGLASDRKLRLFAVACHIDIKEWRGWGDLPDDTHPGQGFITALQGAQMSVGIKVGQAHEERLDAADKAKRADLMRCVFGNPWRPPTPLVRYRIGLNRQTDTATSCWLTWSHGTVPAIAQRIYDDRDFAAMAILADALEDAGCSNEAILAHCRGSKCKRCNGQGRHKLNAPHHLIGCERCNGTGQIFDIHARGCWVIDLLLGKS